MDKASKRYRALFLRALLPAVWRGLEKTDTLIVVLIIAVWAWSLIWPHVFHDPYHPPGWVVALLAAGFVLYQLYKAALSLYAEERSKREELEQRLTPRITIGAPHVAPTPMTQYGEPVNATYLRLRVLNSTDGVLSRCSANLEKVQALGREGWRTLNYHDNLAMGWSNKTGDESRHLNIQPHSVELLDVVYGVEHGRALHLATLVPAGTYANLMTAPAEYQFTIKVAAEETAPVVAQVRVLWGFGNTLSLQDNPVNIISSS